MTEIKKTSAEATLNGEKITIQKLKAGKYYEAQKLYVGMIDVIRRTTAKDAKPQEKSGKADNKSNEVVSIDVAGLYSTFPQEVVKLVAFCIDRKADELFKDAYPEEISDMATKVIELNNFNENLKNSVAPLGNLGAEKA